MAENTEVSATVCATYSACSTVYEGRPDGCAWSADILISKCPNDTYVYRLVTPEGCNVAYCAGEFDDCEDGEIWDPNSEACISTWCFISISLNLRGARPFTFSSQIYVRVELKKAKCYGSWSQNTQVLKLNLY